jgi:ACS family hexuronate transporter-like MFS transporter
MSKPETASSLTTSVQDRARSLRWVILGLLFCSTFLNYFDRQTLSVLKPILKEDLHLTDTGYGHLVTIFMVPYIVMYLLSGPLVERLGRRASMSLFVGVWSLATLMTGFTRSFYQLAACRFVMGAAEPGNFPAALRVVSTWFPANLRGFASSICTAGSALGAVFAPPLIAFIALQHGWRAAFIVPGVVGLLWVVAWWSIYREPKLTVEEAAKEVKPAWFQLWRRREVWGILLAGLVSTPVWFFYLFWLPGYLQENLGLTLQQVGWLGWIPFLAADLGGIVSGLASDRLIKAGWAPVNARLTVLGTAACLAPVGIFTMHAPHLAVALAIFSLVGLVCQTWFVNIGALITDLFPRTWVASVQGIYGAFGAIGGLAISASVGPVVDRVGYGPVFLVTGLLHVAAFGFLFSLCKNSKATTA